MMTTVPTAARGLEPNGMEVRRQRFHAQPADTGNFFELEAKNLLSEYWL